MFKKDSYETSAYRPLIDQAKKALDQSYSPYSHFKVGAALEDGDGKVWLGGNIENASYGATNCAERTAIFKAVSAGVRDFRALAVVGRHWEEEEIAEDMTSPCGICRQVLAEFCPPDMPVVLANRQGEVHIYEVRDLLPLAFTKENLNES